MIPNLRDLHAALVAAQDKPDLQIKEGDRVASFSHPEDDVRFGFSDHTVAIIGTVNVLTPEIEGCCRYYIIPEVYLRADLPPENARHWRAITPPVNGSLNLTRGTLTFGVIRITEG